MQKCFQEKIDNFIAGKYQIDTSKMSEKDKESLNSIVSITNGMLKFYNSMLIEIKKINDLKRDQM